ncbi:PREDICTED: TNF receptor-associated factor 4-like [Amphimedon queenslandica]|uniref:RING-type E3 ubiquitin transferase n=1 Tax=Amphimedon queenslandica TaxID=400682 RepID=A0A1X7VEP9_AMPQE|nr:PREDICTED: TNF receptor-associated factor 4-like [Amphimedon queenslandica]|eukprot:XP_011410445.2 PREDICTED: TNF receptor-associated factor 4-like [Amphimedon queenslandica]
MMAEAAGAGIEFVIESNDSPLSPQIELKCPICFELLIEDPQLVSCCGHHFCGGCLKKLKKKVCPLCKEKFQSIPDKGHKRYLHSLKVYCLKRSEGCAWEGELKNLSSHLSKTGDCQFSKELCLLGCGELVLRALMEDHKRNECLKRIVKCHICSTYTGTAQDFTQHKLMCPELEMTCPFPGCSVTRKRKYLSIHVSICPSNVAKCGMGGGCTWSGCPRDLSNHVLKDHSLASSSLETAKDKELKTLKNTVALQKSEIVRLNAKVAELNSKVSNQRSTLSSQLKTIKQLKNEIEEFEAEADFSDLELIPQDVVLQNFRALKYKNGTFSSGVIYFTSPPSGYAMELYVYPNGIGSGYGTHVSISLHIVPGRFDQELEWPYSGEAVEVRLFDKYKKNCHGKWLKFDANSSAAASSRPDAHGTTEHGFGFEQFISYAQVERYLFDNDCLLFELHPYED